MTTDPNRLLKPYEAAAFLGLQPCTLAAWREDGAMPDLAFFKIGKAVRYRYGDVLAFIETRRATSTLAARALPQATTPPQSPSAGSAPPSFTSPSGRGKPKSAAKDGAQGQKSLF